MKISVVIPVYNSESTIVRAVESIAAEATAGAEIVVIDDGSTDATPDVLESYKPMLCVVRQANAGPAAARNEGVRRSKGEFVAFLDSDDYWLPGRLETTVNALENNPKAVLSFCDYIAVDDHSNALAGRSF